MRRIRSVVLRDNASKIGAVFVIDMQTREVLKGIPTGDKAAEIINTHTNLFEVPGVYQLGHKN